MYMLYVYSFWVCVFGWLCVPATRYMVIGPQLHWSFVSISFYAECLWHTNIYFAVALIESFMIVGIPYIHTTLARANVF